MIMGGQYSAAYKSAGESVRLASNNLLASAAAAAAAKAVKDGAVAVGKGAVSIPISGGAKGFTYVFGKLLPIYRSARNYYSSTGVPEATSITLCPQTQVNSTFRTEFYTMTDMSLDESLLIYKKQTGKDLKAEQVQKMFTDADYARDLMLSDKDIHTTYRKILNYNVPATEKEAIQRNFVKLPWHESIYHNPTTNLWENTKYVGPDGHREVVYDKSGDIVNNRDLIGTFNFFGPEKRKEHTAADIETYAKWGN